VVERDIFALYASVRGHDLDEDSEEELLRYIFDEYVRPVHSCWAGNDMRQRVVDTPRAASWVRLRADLIDKFEVVPGAAVGAAVGAAAGPAAGAPLLANAV
jgi:hypothetical protein